jgi:hypothetical protein
MLLTTDHLLALDALAASEAAGHARYTIAEDAHTQNLFRVLELQGLVVPEAGQSYRLTYPGYEALRLLGNMQAAGLLPWHGTSGDYSQLKAGWRFLGPEVLAALDAAARSGGRVGPLTEELLRVRGFIETETSSNEEQERSSLRLNVHGEAWLDFARRNRPHLEINGDLAHALLRIHPGYAESHTPGIMPAHIALLEAMELLTWSVPDGEIATLTTLGQAVYEALRKGGYPTADVVLDEPILDLLSALEDRGSASYASGQLMELQNLGYVDEDGAVSAAGQAALRACHLLHQEAPERSVTFAITESEVELLAAVRQLSERAGGSSELPSKDNLQRALVERLAESYKELVRRYGRTLTDASRVARKRQAWEMLEQLKERDQEFNLKDREHWFKQTWNLDELLVSLESLDLLLTDSEGAARVYRLTPQGQEVLDEQGETPRTIRATAVKAITAVPGRFSALATAWVEQAKEEGLIGTGGITQAGRLYARLAEHSRSWTTLTQLEAQTLVNLPAVDVDMADLQPRPHATLEEERQAWALDKLEARELIERLVDGQIVRTEAGQLVARAVSGDALELANPVTPAIVRLLSAIQQVGTLFVKERKVRVAPRQWAEVERLTGLEPEAFQEAVYVARLGHYIGDANINEAGANLLEAMAKLQGKPRAEGTV